MQVSSRWKINKLGLINFWYYDFEEFELEDGKLMLRGANGSGKSVTMQSFIPLLLDGNRRPERLDPFGTNARKMENYLLMYNDEKERTAYLYMEFKKQDSQSFLTLGIGLKAVRGKGVDAWYFIIDDGRRINIDMNLFIDKGYEKVPLTKKELENRVGSGGFYTESQVKYKGKVNEYLFGYSDIENYDELIDLLINIRTPKLSKDFKPTSMYEILENSLRQLTEDDLRPMSEAMENMDNIKLRIEQLEDSLRALRQIDIYYTKYNNYMLYDKSKKYLEKNDTIKKLLNEKRAMEETLSEVAADVSGLQEEAERLEYELKAAETKLSGYKDSDILRTKERLEQTKESLHEMYDRKEGLVKEYDGKKLKLNQSYGRLREAEDETESLKAKRDEALFEMDGYAEEFDFKNHELFKEDMNLPFIKEALIKLRGRIREGRDLIAEYERANERYDDVLKRKDAKNSEIGALNSKLKEADEYLTTVKEEFIERTRLWSSRNVELKLSEKDLQDTARAVMSAQDFEDLVNINAIVSGYNNRIKGELQLKEQELKNNINVLENEINDINTKIDDLKKSREAEFERPDEVDKSREILSSRGIPYIPLYKAVDFKGNISEEIKVKIESAMVDMGIIDSLIVPAKYKSQVRAIDEKICDKFILPRPNFLAYNLSEYLKADMTEAGGFTCQEIDDVLKSIQLDMGDTYIDENGNYGIGIISGRANNNYELKYIGAASRKKHRERQIEALLHEISDRKGKIASIEENLKNMGKRADVLKHEFASFPGTEDIKESIKLIDEIERQISGHMEILKAIEKEYYDLQACIKGLKVKVYEVCEGLAMDKTLKAFEDAGKAAEDYHSALVNFEALVNRIGEMDERVRLINDNIEGFNEDLDRLMGETNKLNNLIKKGETEKQALEETLEKLGYEDIKREIDECCSIMNLYPAKILKSRESISGFIERISNLKERVDERDSQIEKESKILDVLGSILIEEYNLKYVMELENFRNTQELSGLILKSIGETGQKSREDYDKDLFEAFNKYSGALRDYQPTVPNIFRKDVLDDEYREIYQRSERKDIRFRIGNRTLPFNELKKIIAKEIEDNKILLSDREKEFFQEILLKTISNKIRSKIYQSQSWVNKMNELMESMNTSSSLKLTLKWTAKKAENELQMDTRKLIDIFEKDTEFIRQEDIDNLSKHFSSKVKEIAREYEEKGDRKNYQTIIKDILDYRKWYEFKLYCKKEGESQKELTNNAFFQLSGGEKAMAMYIPLFTAVYSRYDIADKKDCPRIAALDEAFAGVDEGNIRDMFRIMKEMDIDYILNSQVLWGDYDTVDSLAISEIVRPENSDVVTVLRYYWNGREKIVRI